jgi:hypothetical protein
VHSRSETKPSVGGKHGAFGTLTKVVFSVGGTDGITDLEPDTAAGFNSRVVRITTAPTTANKHTNTTTGKMRRSSDSFIVCLFISTHKSCSNYLRPSS